MPPARIHARQDSLIEAAYIKWRDAVLGYVMKRIGRDRREDAEDLVQNTFLQILTYDTFLEGDGLVRLIYSIARNQVIDFLRHHACIRAARDYFKKHSSFIDCSTEERVAVNELEQLEKNCLKQMPERKAQVYIMYVHEGKTVTEISETLGLSPRTVENHIFRARVNLHRSLKLVS